GVKALQGSDVAEVVVVVCVFVGVSQADKEQAWSQFRQGLEGDASGVSIGTVVAEPRSGTHPFTRVQGVFESALAQLVAPIAARAPGGDKGVGRVGGRRAL